MDYTKNSIQIQNKKEYTFRLEMDDIKGIIRLTKNKDRKSFTRITDRNIPITESQKWSFHRERSGYSETITSRYNFIGSFIDRDKSPNVYYRWKNFIVYKYKELKQKNLPKNEFNIQIEK